MSASKLCFELSLILFSVSSVFTVGMLIDRYPKIYRFGHTLKKYDKKRLNLRVISVSWPIMICMMLVAFVSLYYYSQSLNHTAENYAYYIAHFSFPVVYFLMPSLIERVTTGATILRVRDDFDDYYKQPLKRHFLEKRFSPSTINEINKGNCYPAYMVVDSLIKFIALVLSPIAYLYQGWWWAGIVGIVIYLTLSFLTERRILGSQESHADETPE